MKLWRREAGGGGGGADPGSMKAASHCSKSPNCWLQPQVRWQAPPEQVPA